MQVGVAGRRGMAQVRDVPVTGFQDAFGVTAGVVAGFAVPLLALRLLWFVTGWVRVDKMHRTAIAMRESRRGPWRDMEIVPVPNPTMVEVRATRQDGEVEGYAVNLPKFLTRAIRAQDSRGWP